MKVTWLRETIDANRVNAVPELVRVAIAIDPPIVWRIPAYMTGIVVTGVDQDGDGYVLVDLSKKYQTDTWAFAASKARRTYDFSRIVVGDHYSTPMVEQIFRHVDPQALNHGAKEFVRDGVTTNGIESAFAVLKRALIGVYHHVEPKHLHRYVNEFAFRLNEGSVERHTMDRIESFVAGTTGKRLTYKAYIQ